MPGTTVTTTSNNHNNSGGNCSNVSGSIIHSNILRIQDGKNDTVYKKYEVLESLGSGSMGNIEKVRLRQEMIGGSAFNPKPRGLLGSIRKHLQRVGKKGGNASASINPRLSESGVEWEEGDYCYALKSIQLDRVSPAFLEELKNEIDIVRSVDHPNIVKAYEVFATRRQIHMVLELCGGGDLYTRSPYTERDAARIAAQIASAVSYLHDAGVVHRDLKFENILFERSDDAGANVKIIDFGLSKKFASTKLGFMTERVGTIYTMAPQVLQGVYSSQADLWSIGVITYMLLSASKPFHAKRRRMMIDLIMRGFYTFDSPVWNGISTEAKDFVQKLLVVNPKKRLTGSEAMEHPWLVNRDKLSDELADETVWDAIDDSLLHYKQTSQLKKLALNVIAHRSTSKEIQELRKVFESLDKSKDGILSYDEFKVALEKLHLNDEEMEQIFHSVDLNQNGHIMYTEFLAACLEAHGHIEEDRIAEAFDRLDSDDTGYISKEDLREALGPECPEEDIREIIKAADKNNDGKISYDEFLQIFRENTSNTVRAYLDENSLSSSNTDCDE